MKFPTYAVLTASTGCLLGDIGGAYKVYSFLLGRSAFTHELAFYAERVQSALKAAIPEIPGREQVDVINPTNWREHLARWEKQFGAEIDLPESLREVLADESNGVDTAVEMFGRDRVTVIKK